MAVNPTPSDLPPQPHGDHSDPLGTLKSTGFDEVLCQCTVCGEWRPQVGQWGGVNSPVCCRACWLTAYPQAGQRAFPGNPLNL